MKRLALLLVPLALSACNSNTAHGPDRESQVQAPPTPAPRGSAKQALDGIAAKAIALETMSDADIASLGGYRGHCVFRPTEVGFPSFHFAPRGSGTLKLNQKLITLPRSGENRFADGELEVRLRPVGGEGHASLPEHELILLLPGAKQEHGYRGYLQCFEAKAA